MKKCRSCGQLKSSSEFSAMSSAKDGFQRECRPCTAKRIRLYRKTRRYRKWFDEYYYRKGGAERVAEYNQTPEQKARKSAYALSSRGRSARARWRRRNVLKIKAHTVLNHAIRDGKIEREPCSGCGAEPAEGHHEDYSRPLEVEWLCRPCHRAKHKEANHLRKLSAR